MLEGNPTEDDSERNESFAEKTARLKGVYDEKFKNALDTGTIAEFMEKVSSFAEHLREEYKDDYEKYPLYHVIAGSTMIKDAETIGGDFPGGDSIEKFIEGL